MTNRLAAATSPYLQQHAENPVDWWEWSPDAFAEARRRDVPVLLSIGYAACHWCHVMAHESFADPVVAELINERFVAIKVDREERPDVDAVYMRATMMLTGGGGWPMTVFCDPAGRPFHAGTYYPPQDREGMPSFTRLLQSIDQAWRTDRGHVDSVAARLTQALQEPAPRPLVLIDAVVAERVPGAGAAWSGLAASATLDLQRSFDPVHGGFGGAPKFPPSTVLEFLLRHHARTGDAMSLTMAELTCEAMARGGMYDQLGGGFARYSVDAAWVVPHFEKMLLDNALLARVYLHLWRLTGSPLAERIARETCDFLLRELATVDGGFASSLDADSDPVLPDQQREGAYYVWTMEQLVQALGHDAPEVARWFSVVKMGTFDRQSCVLQLVQDPPEPQVWGHVRQRLLAARAQRPAPGRDDKVVAGWNGLAIAALAEAGVLLAEPRYIAAARACAQLLADLHVVGGRLLRVSRDGIIGSAAGVLEDYAGVAEGFLVLYQATGELRWLHRAAALIDTARAIFDDGAGGFFDTASDAEALVARLRDASDSPGPAGWSLIAGAMVTLAALTGDTELQAAARTSMTVLLQQQAAAQPRFFGHGLAVLEAMVAGPVQVAVIGQPGEALHRTAMASPSPGLVVAVGTAGSATPQLLAHRGPVEGRPAAYVCRDFACRLPTTDPEELRQQLAARRHVTSRTR